MLGSQGSIRVYYPLTRWAKERFNWVEGRSGEDRDGSEKHKQLDEQLQVFVGVGVWL